MSDDPPQAHRTGINLSRQLVTNEQRLKDTLAHEMCHIAQYYIDRDNGKPHGRSFRNWADLFERRVRGVVITTTHNYC